MTVIGLFINRYDFGYNLTRNQHLCDTFKDCLVSVYNCDREIPNSRKHATISCAGLFPEVRRTYRLHRVTGAGD